MLYEVITGMCRSYVLVYDLVSGKPVDHNLDKGLNERLISFHHPRLGSGRPDKVLSLQIVQIGFDVCVIIVKYILRGIV